MYIILEKFRETTYFRRSEDNASMEKSDVLL